MYFAISGSFYWDVFVNEDAVCWLVNSDLRIVKSRSGFKTGTERSSLSAAFFKNMCKSDIKGNDRRELYIFVIRVT
jgi:hypothetical protein